MRRAWEGQALDVQGPYVATTRSMNSASTEYMMKSDIRDTWWPSTSTCTWGLSAVQDDKHHR